MFFGNFNTLFLFLIYTNVIVLDVGVLPTNFMRVIQSENTQVYAAFLASVRQLRPRVLATMGWLGGAFAVMTFRQGRRSGEEEVSDVSSPALSSKGASFVSAPYAATPAQK